MLYELTEAMKSEATIKLEINGHMDPYFGVIREIQHGITGQIKAHLTIEHHDCLSTHLLSDITDIIT